MLRTIGRGGIDGSNFTPSFIASQFMIPRSVAVDAGHVYWTNLLLTGSVGRANLDGSSPKQSFIPGIPSAFALAVTQSSSAANFMESSLAVASKARRPVREGIRISST